MKRLIIHGDPGVRNGAVIERDGDEKVLFGVTRNGDWHGPERVQLWCVMGDREEYEDYEKRNYIPHWLDVETVDAEDVVVREKQTTLTLD
ncbi:HAH_0734 family protein [Halarchaeum sp. P4]|uniref:HAH_0734 family protein n=1 Tax=Halarchaeum sp. P4 TaxID=3421639 RepID=UPI003EB75EC7